MRSYILQIIRNMTLFTLVTAMSCAQASDIYRYEDEAGRIVYTNVPPKSKNKNMRLVTEQISIIPGSRAVVLQAPNNGTSTHRNSTPDSLAGLPAQIDNTTQQGRDNTRKSILLDELNTEVKALSDAKKQLQLHLAQTLSTTSSAPPQQPEQPNTAIQQTIQSHERNINALQRELGMR